MLGAARYQAGPRYGHADPVPYLSFGRTNAKPSTANRHSVRSLQRSGSVEILAEFRPCFDLEISVYEQQILAFDCSQSGFTV